MDDHEADFASGVDQETWAECGELSRGATRATGRLHAVVYFVGSTVATVFDTGRKVDEFDDCRYEEGEAATPELDLDANERALLWEAFTVPGSVRGKAWTPEQRKEWMRRGGGAAWAKAEEQLRPRVEAEAAAERRRQFTVPLLRPTLTLEQRFRLPAREPRRPREQRARRSLRTRARTRSAQRAGPRRSDDPDPPPLARLRALLRWLRGRAA